MRSARFNDIRTILRDNNLQNVIVFNDVYEYVTTCITDECDRGVYKNPKVVRRIVNGFVEAYADAIHAYGDNSQCPRPWRWCMNVARRVGGAPSWLIVSLGAYAHITYDLPRVLCDVGQDSEILAADYTLIGECIYGCIPHSLEYAGVNNTLAKLMIKPVVKLVLRLWRRQAWDSYIRMCAT